MEKAKSDQCLNCGAPLHGTYCAECGQKNLSHPITFREVGGEFLDSVFLLDAPFPRTFLRMFYQPGHLVRAYLQGKRKRYYAPVRYLILTLAISVLMSSLMGFDPIDNYVQNNQESLNQKTPTKEVVKAARFLHRYLNFFVFIFPFTIALVSKLFFWRAAYNMTERMVFGFYLSAQYLIIASVFVSLTVFDPRWSNGNYLFNLIFFSLAFAQFMHTKNKVWRIAKSVMAAFLSLILYFGIAFFLADFIVKTFNIAA